METNLKLYEDKCFITFGELAALVDGENIRQLKTWGVQTRTMFEWLAYLTEEVGELARAVSENTYRGGSVVDIRDEAIQVATLALKIAEMVIR